VIEIVALVAAVILPLWNLPLIFHIMKRKSSQDVSLSWAIGVWVCFVLMAPAALMSEDMVWRVFNVMNLILFTGVTATVLIYRRKS